MDGGGVRVPLIGLTAPTASNTTGPVAVLVTQAEEQAPRVSSISRCSLRLVDSPSATSRQTLTATRSTGLRAPIIVTLQGATPGLSNTIQITNAVVLAVQS